MPLHYSKIHFGPQSVREVDGLEGWTSNSDDAIVPMKWSKICSKSSYGKIVNFSNITVDGTSYSSVRALSINAYGSALRMYSKWVINNPLLPGETLELSFYASRGLNLNNSDEASAGGTTRVAQITFSTNPTKFDDHLNFPTTTANRGAADNSTAPFYEYGDGNLPASNGSNVGVVTSWQSKSGRSESTWVDCPNTPGSEPATLAFDDVPNETSSEFTKVYRIVIRNDSDMPAYLAMTNYVTNNLSFTSTFHDIQLKVTSTSIDSNLSCIDDITHHLTPSSPIVENPVSGQYQIDMKSKSVFNMGPGVDEQESLYGYGLSKDMFNYYAAGESPLVVPFDVYTQAAYNSVYAGIGNNPGTPGRGKLHIATDAFQSGANSVFYMAPANGRLHSIHFRSNSTSYSNSIKFSLCKFNGTIGVAGNDSDVSVIQTLEVSKVEGQHDSRKFTNKSFSSGGSTFSAGDILVLKVEVGGNTIGLAQTVNSMIGTMTLMIKSGG